jgi:hypothetical protein
MSRYAGSSRSFLSDALFRIEPDCGDSSPVACPRAQLLARVLREDHSGLGRGDKGEMPKALLMARLSRRVLQRARGRVIILSHAGRVEATVVAVQPNDEYQSGREAHVCDGNWNAQYRPTIFGRIGKCCARTSLTMKRAASRLHYFQVPSSGSR